MTSVRQELTEISVDHVHAQDEVVGIQLAGRQ